MFIVSEYTLVRNEVTGVLTTNNEHIPGCPCCGKPLKYRDSRLRIRKHEGGERDYLSIRRFQCTACKRYHNELPDVLLPYKHYKSEVICGVIDGIVTPGDQDSEDYPSVSTMLYWLRWFQMNLANLEGYLRSVGYSALGLGKDILFSGKSLLEAIRNKYHDWLEKTIRIIYNSAGFLPAFY